MQAKNAMHAFIRCQVTTCIYPNSFSILIRSKIMEAILAMNLVLSHGILVLGINLIKKRINTINKLLKICSGILNTIIKEHQVWYRC